MSAVVSPTQHGAPMGAVSRLGMGAPSLARHRRCGNDVTTLDVAAAPNSSVGRLPAQIASVLTTVPGSEHPAQRVQPGRLDPTGGHLPVERATGSAQGM